MAELFGMSGSIDGSNIGDKTLSDIVEQIKSKWNAENYKTKTVEHLRNKLIEHITGLKDSMTAMFKDKTLRKGQMLLFDTAYRNVRFNQNISDRYKALNKEISVVNGYPGIEYILVNPRLVLTSKVVIEIHKDENKSLKQIIGERISENPSENLIHSIGINRVEDKKHELKYAIVYIAKSKNNLPMFDKDITVFMLGKYKGPDVSIGVNRDNFDYHNTMNDTLRTMYQFINIHENNGEKVEINSVLKNYKQQITYQYNTISSLFTGVNVPKNNKYIYNVLPQLPNINVYANLDNNIRQRFDYCIFRWMELYYEFYEFCLQHQPIQKDSKKDKHTIDDPLNRCRDTLEYQIYKYQTNGIKLFLLSLFFGLYDNVIHDSSKQIYTPEMLLYDIGRIIETPPTHRKSSKTLPENLSSDVFFRRQSRTSSEGSNSSRRDSSRTDSNILEIQDMEDDNSLSNQNSPQSNSDTSRSNSVSSSPQESARSGLSSRDSESGETLDLNNLPNNRGNESNSSDDRFNAWTNASFGSNANRSDDESGVSEQVVSENDDESEDAQSVYSDTSTSPINVKKDIEDFDYTKMLSQAPPPSQMNNRTEQPNSTNSKIYKKPIQQLKRPYKHESAQKVQKQSNQLYTQKHVNGPKGVNPMDEKRRRK